MLQKRLFFIFLSSILLIKAEAQLSISTDLTLLRNLSEQQKFWAIGQSVRFEYAVSKKVTFYGLVNYYGKGKFTNTYTAQAKTSAITPQTTNYHLTSEWRFNQLSLGWKHFFVGGFENEDKVNIYALAGFGLLFNKVINKIENLDTVKYIPNGIQAGSSTQRRLTFDLGAGVEFPLGGNFFGYTDVRTWIPTTSYPSKYIINENKFSVVMISAGVRFLFSFEYY